MAIAADPSPPSRRAASLSVVLVVALTALSCGGDAGTADPRAKAHAVRLVEGSASTLRTSVTTPQALRATLDIERQLVEGRFRNLRFEARLTGEGQAVASFERIEGMTLMSTVHGPHEATLEWRGTTLDGRGEASVEEREAMAHFADRLKADELALIALDLACRPGADDLDPALGAALLFPWQVLLKYQPDGEIPTPRQATTLSECQYAPSPLAAIDRERIPSPSVVALSTEQPVPMAIGYFPLDLKGLPPDEAPADNADE